MWTHMALDALRMGLMQFHKMRLGVAGAARGNTPVLELMAIDTEKIMVFGLIHRQQGFRARMTSTTVSRLNVIFIGHF